MSAVVDFPTRQADRIIWVCNCGCSTFSLRADGESECAHCGALAGADVNPGEWRSRLPDPDAPVRDLKSADNTRINREMGTAKRAIQTILSTDPGELAAIVVLHSDGLTRTWSPCDFETRKQQRWLRARLRDALELLLP